MRKNGFTLIELLAVIVILAIIALIATPIILGIINDAREKANERSVELYASAVRNGIAAYQLREGKEVAAGTYTKETLPFEVEYDGKVDCTSIILSEDSKVSLEGCKVNNGTKEYSYGTKQGSTVEVGTMSICKPAEKQYFATNPLEPGYKYECDVDPNKKGYDYMFYVLNSDGTNVNLIMDSNINISGNAVKGEESDLGNIEWLSMDDWDKYANPDLKVFGPFTAMNHLNAATSSWSNVLNLNIIHNDESGNFEKFEITGKARLPYKSEVSEYLANAKNGYLYDNLDSGCLDAGYNPVSCDVAVNKFGIYEEGLSHISLVMAYWTFATNQEAFNESWFVDWQGHFEKQYVFTTYAGVRPVINLSI